LFDRYNIHDERDQREALRATQAYREQQAAHPPWLDPISPTCDLLISGCVSR
jgi:hypothetical protein